MGVFNDLKEKLNSLFSESKDKYKISDKWLTYRLGATVTHCKICSSREDKIYSKMEMPILPEHINCRCYLEWLHKILVGQATNLGVDGADYFLYKYGCLPSNYITKEQAYRLGWKPQIGNLNEIAKGKVIGGNIFYNREEKLPSAVGRVWYECDIDYNGKYRGSGRLLYSNDGLIFKTDNHYKNFISVEWGD